MRKASLHEESPRNSHILMLIAVPSRKIPAGRILALAMRKMANQENVVVVAVKDVQMRIMLNSQRL